MQPEPILNHPRNNIIFHGLLASLRAVAELERRGFEVVGIDVFGKRTTIQVRNSEATDHMIREQLACYYKWQKEDGQHLRFGQFQLENCRITWVERGH